MTINEDNHLSDLSHEEIVMVNGGDLIPWKSIGIGAVFNWIDSNWKDIKSGISSAIDDFYNENPTLK